MVKFRLSIAAIGLYLTASVCAAGAPGVSKYEFLANSHWFVPESTLPAMAMIVSTGETALVNDQTVWTITDYSEGYFWGTSVVKLFDPADDALVGTQCTRMLGNVTPDGHVLIAFTNVDEPTALNAVRGTGNLVRDRKGRWRFENMQMASGQLFLVTHWSFMDQCRTGDPCEQLLPGTTGESLSEFTASCAP
jgi:hypothetical protein